MKIMYISDIHGSKRQLEIIKDIYHLELPDKIIVLGDIFYGGYSSSKEIEEILLSFNNCYVIRGNCDTEIDVMTSNLSFMDFYYFEAFGKKIFCSHGNVYNITKHPEKEFNCLVYGHTHRGMIIKENDKYYLNPGSISYPRGGSNNSYLIMDDKGIFLKDLNRNIIEKMLW